MKYKRHFYLLFILILISYCTRVGFFFYSADHVGALSPSTNHFMTLLTLIRSDIQNNSVLLAVISMLVLALIGANIVISLLISAIVGGLASGMSLKTTLDSFNNGISFGANVALSYALLGAFAVAISKSGLPHVLADFAVKQLTVTDRQKKLKWAIIILIGVVSISSQNLIPIHIAFIPLLIPPLLYVMARLQIDRRAIACVMAFGLIMPYMFLPVGFGNIFLNSILLKNIAEGGLNTDNINVMHAMFIPAAGMFMGLLVAVLWTYRRPRHYDLGKIENVERTKSALKPMSICVSLLAIVLAFIVQIYSGSMILGALIGFLLFVLTRTIKWGEADSVFSDGVKMMASIGFVMITAQGFAQVIKDTGNIIVLVESSTALFAENKIIASFCMMMVGLIITMGIGSSFSTVPIIASIYTPLCINLGYSPLATVCLIGAAGAIGDAGAPASDTILASTSGLNVDGQHNHMRDGVIPTFIHFNIPLFMAGWFGSLIL